MTAGATVARISITMEGNDMTFDVDELNQHAIDRAREMLDITAEPVPEDRRYEIAEEVVRILQIRQHDHGMGHMLELAQGYGSRSGVRSKLFAAHGVTGPQVDAAIQGAARVLWNEA